MHDQAATQIYLCQLSDLEPDQPRCYRVAGVDVFVVRHADRVFATQNRCGHAGAALNRGEYTDGLIVCPLHGAGFRVEDGSVEWPAIIPPPMALYSSSDNPRLRKFGELLETIETLPIRTFPVEIRGDEVLITIGQ